MKPETFGLCLLKMFCYSTEEAHKESEHFVLFLFSEIPPLNYQNWELMSHLSLMKTINGAKNGVPSCVEVDIGSVLFEKGLVTVLQLLSIWIRSHC